MTTHIGYNKNYADMKLYASIIQRLEKELNIEVNDFPDLRLYACDLEEKQPGVNHIGYILLLLIDGLFFVECACLELR
jgi:hypothetical protein